MDNVKNLRAKLKNLKVLFVDDEEGIRKGAGALFRKFFDSVVICCDGEEGLAAFVQHGDFDLVVTDILMPKMNGIDMMKKIKEINPNVLSIFITASRELHEFSDMQNTISLQKPLGFSDILEAMKKIGESP